jgi:hypothetical protein
MTNGTRDDETTGSSRENDSKHRSSRVVVEIIPLKFVREVASAGAMAEASHVERGTSTRHLCYFRALVVEVVNTLGWKRGEMG